MFCCFSTIYNPIFKVLLVILMAKVQIIKALFIVHLKSSDDILTSLQCQLLDEVSQESLIIDKGKVITASMLIIFLRGVGFNHSEFISG